MSTTDNQAFSSVREDNVAEYTKMSVPAVCALVLGIISFLAIRYSVALLIPVAGVLVALYSLWSITHGSARVVGRMIALIGLTLSLLFGVWAAAYQLTQERLFLDQARQRTVQWLELIRQDRLNEAYQLTLPPSRRILRDQKPDSYYEDEEVGEQFTDFKKRDLVKQLSAAGSNGEYYLDPGHSGIVKERSRKGLAITTELQCQVEGGNGEATEPQGYLIHVVRTNPPDSSEPWWKIGRFERNRRR